MSPGGTTTYTGLDLAMGSLPSVDNDHLRPATERQSDNLGVQPLVAVAALLVVGTLLVARATLVDRVAEQATVPFPAGKSAGDYVRWGIGFWIVFALIAVGAALGAIGARREPNRLHPGGP